MPEHSIEITIQPVYRKNNYIYIPVKYSEFFPAGKPLTVKPIEIETGSDAIKATLQYNSKSYI